MRLLGALALCLALEVSSGQFLITLRRMGEAVPAPQPAEAQPEPLSYKQQVLERNHDCYQLCAKEFETAEGSKAACERGCRLFGLAESNEPQLTSEQHRGKCHQDCERAYPVLVEQHSCQSGCRHQKPKEQDEKETPVAMPVSGTKEDGEGPPVLMSVVRKLTIDSDGNQEIRRSQSSLVVHDGDKVRVIEGPAQVSVSAHGSSAPEVPGMVEVHQGPFSQLFGDMIHRMRQSVHNMMLRAQEEQQEYQAAEPRTGQDNNIGDVKVSAGLRPEPSVWQCLMSRAPHYVVLLVLIVVTLLILYTCYCLVCSVRRRRRRLQESLVQNELLAEDLPPKYAAVLVDADTGKELEVKEPPPAYSTIAADPAELPPKPDV